jgi:ribosomal protein S18 acetylase RimI-like enzyme
MAIDIRPSRPEEHAEAGRVTALAYREFADSENWEAYLLEIAAVDRRADLATVLVAVEDGRILGSATLELTERIEEGEPALRPGEASIRMLGVDPAERGRGVARALVDACFALARDAGKTRMTLHTTKRMKAAQAMYEGMGFERHPDRVFPDGFVLLTYERPISG